ncbi:AraC-like DNA-binding protein [Sphingomonas sp. SORGH_AS870]|uniref:AraC family transcriptional regulator n=1 Tax=Sphingomonas sp. SORGH_AS_0870 TaxID=3041801 RepID=UPI00285CD08A|nr:AraC family transcriptional regulator [Sphingomonas sp. SORGH_AS_0870]MDR6145857.1 AraC-like DNA-binding protein [Sphingomonas sp. SORGH_AS_0870]
MRMVGAEEVVAVTIGQATAMPMDDVFISRAFVCLVQSGEKQIHHPAFGSILARPGDVVAFPAGALVTMENRPTRDKHYRAEGLFYPPELIALVFGDAAARSQGGGVPQVLAGDPEAAAVFDHLADTLSNDTLPAAIRRHRAIEPLVWLHDKGVHLPYASDGPLQRLRALIDADLAHPWRAAEVATALAMSEATFRRWLGHAGLRFSVVLRNARLERGLLMLQTSADPVSRIALECGFLTPSHFTEAFRGRFGHPPRAIRNRAI